MTQQIEAPRSTMKRTTAFALALMALVGMASSAYAQRASDTRSDLRIPSSGVGLSFGYETEKVNGLEINGGSLLARYVYAWDTYPILFGGVDAKISRLELDVPAGELKGYNYGIGPMAGFMIPFDLFFKMKDLPRGAGMPIYVGYSPFNRLDFSDSDGKIDGQSLRFGAQLPIPIRAPLVFNLQLEYETYFYEDEETIPGIRTVNDLDRSGWTYLFQIGIPLTYHKP